MLLILTGKVAAQCPGSTYAGADSTICFSNNVVYLNGLILRPNGSAGTGYWTNYTGLLPSGSTTLSGLYYPSQAEVNAGFVDLVLVSNQNCNPSQNDTVHISIQSVQSTAVSGPMGICEFSSGNAYSLPSVSGLNYDWHVVGGYITSGSGTNAVSVTWGAKGPGYIYVVQTDNLGCVGVSSIDPISRFHFNTPELDHAEIGADAISYDSDAKTNGSGFVITTNCASTKGIDLKIAGSTFDRGKMCMTFSWQRDEGNASFFKRAGTEFYMSGGMLYTKTTQYDSVGNSKVVGPINTNYTVPNDDVFRYFTYCYDSASGIARVLVNDSVVWNYSTGTASSLYWVGAGNADIGTIMDGNCSGNALLDWVNISIPISIYGKPETALSGTDPICINGQAAYYCDTPSYVTYAWTATGGTILNGQTNPYTNIKWTQAGSKHADLLLTDTRTGCDSSYSFAVTVNSLPSVSISGNDSFCLGDTDTYTLSSSGHLYSWGSSLGDTSSASAFQEVWTSAGQKAVYLNVLDSSTTCINADTMDVWVQDYPDPVLSMPSALCQNESALVQVSNTSNVTYTWTATGGSLQSGQGTTEVNVLYTSSGNYSIGIQVVDNAFGCSISKSVNVTVNPKPASGALYHY